MKLNIASGTSDCSGTLMYTYSPSEPVGPITQKIFSDYGLTATIKDAEGLCSNTISDYFNNKKKKEEQKPVIPHPKRIFFDMKNGCTTVEWMDCTKTTVKIEEGGRFTQYGGFCACLAKKIYGSTGKSIIFMESAIAEAERPKRERQEKHERAKLAKAAAREWEKKKFEADVQNEMYRKRIRNEALDRMIEKPTELGGDQK